MVFDVVVILRTMYILREVGREREGGREGEGGREEEYLYGGLERGHVAMLLCLLTAIGGCTRTGTDTITGTGTGTDTFIKGWNVECGIWI